MASTMLAALLFAALVAVVASMLMWRRGRSRIEAAEGRRTLAAMRWREFSQFVITALQAQGFEANALETTGNARNYADHVLTRDGRSWLLSCRQGVDQVLTEKELAEVTREVRRRGAAGGIVATLGAIDPSARRNPGDVELLDGDALWPLISPLLPAGLHEHIDDQTGSRLKRNVALVWAGAMVAGAALGYVLTLMAPEPGPTTLQAPSVATAPATGSQAARTATPAPVAATSAPAEGSPEDLRQRQALIEALNAVAGIEHATWATRSTLLIYTKAEAGDLHDPVCGVIRGFDALRASRVQMQPAGGEGATPGAVRFFHCSTF